MKIHKAIVTVFGLGYAPFGPGTFGTLGAVLLFALCDNQGCDITTIPLIISTIVIAALGIYSTDKVIPVWGEDPSKVVVDEFVGYMITMILVPLNLKTILIGFVLFRFFDILKPLGIRTIDKNVKGGLGVMLDDVLAGIYACAALHAIIYFFPHVSA